MPWTGAIERLGDGLLYRGDRFTIADGGSLDRLCWRGTRIGQGGIERVVCLGERV